MAEINLYHIKIESIMYYDVIVINLKLVCYIRLVFALFNMYI